MAVVEDEFSSLSKRLFLLEEQVYGKSNAAKDQNIKVQEALVTVNNKINNGLAGRERVKSVLKKTDEIEKFLDPAVGEKMTLDDSTKLDIILAEEQHMRHTANQLEMLKQLLPILDSEHIKAAPMHSAKLAQLSQVHVRQEEGVAQFSDDVKNLLATYNNIISTISKQFVLWEDIVTKLELAAKPKKKI